MALIKLKVQTTGPGAPRVVSDDVLDLHPGDRLLFAADNGQDVLVDLGDENTGTLVALVKFKGGLNFEAGQLADGRTVVKLIPPGGNGDPPDPPN